MALDIGVKMQKASPETIAATVSIGDPYIRISVVADDIITPNACQQLYENALSKYNADVRGTYSLTDVVLKPAPAFFGSRIVSWDDYIRDSQGFFTMQFQTQSPTKAYSMALDLWNEGTAKSAQAPAETESNLAARVVALEKTNATLVEKQTEHEKTIQAWVEEHRESKKNIKALLEEHKVLLDGQKELRSAVSNLTGNYVRLQSILRRKVIYASRARVLKDFSVPLSLTFHKYIGTLTPEKRRQVEMALGGHQQLEVLMTGDDAGNIVAHEVDTTELPDLAAAVTSVTDKRRRTALLQLFKYAFSQDAEEMTFASTESASEEGLK